MIGSLLYVCASRPRDGRRSSGSVWAPPRKLAFFPRLDGAMLAAVNEDDEGVGVWNAFSPYLARQMSRVATQTPGMRDTPFLVRRGELTRSRQQPHHQRTDFLPRFGPLGSVIPYVLLDCI